MVPPNNTKKASRKAVKARISKNSPSFYDLGRGIISVDIEVDAEDAMIEETKTRSIM